MFLQCMVKGWGKKRGHDSKYWGEILPSNQDELNKIVKELFFLFSNDFDLELFFFQWMTYSQNTNI